MELLVILLGEFLFFPFVAAIGAFFNFIFSLLCFVLDLLFSVLFSAKATVTSDNKTETQKSSILRSRFLLFSAKITGGFFIVGFVSLIVVNFFFFSQTIEWAVGQVSQKTQTQISFNKVGGNLFYGQFYFNGLSVKKDIEGKTRFDLEIDTVDVDLKVLSLLSSPITIEKLNVVGVDGDIKPDRVNKNQKPSQGDTKAATIKAKKEFVISDLSISRVDIDLQLSDQKPLQVVIEAIESAPFRSNYAIFDTFFRANISGSVDGHKVSIRSREEGQGRITRWDLDRFPINIVGEYTDKSPLNWLKEGTVDIQVEDRWEYSDKAEIDMDWSIRFQDVVVEYPDDTSIFKRSLSSPFVNYMNSKGGDMDLNFTLAMNESQFESSSSLDAAGLWDAVIDQMVQKLSDGAEEKKEAIKSGVEEKIKGFKNFLKQKAE